MSTAGIGKLVFTESTIEHGEYLIILKNNFLKYVKKFQTRQQPLNRASVVKVWLLYNVLKQMHSPAQSSDLISTENLGMINKADIK